VTVVVRQKKGQQSSLRHKIREHRLSEAHIAAEKKLRATASDSEPIVAGINNLSENEHLETCKIFRTAYHIAKNDRPYTDHPDLVTLQHLNGIEMGRLLQSNVVCCDIIEHISGSMRASLVKSMLSSRCHFAVLIDESTSLSQLSCLVVYIRTTFDLACGPVTFFFDLVELAATNAEGIETALLQCLTEHGLTDDFLKSFWIGLGVDGASVMLGAKSGVAARLKNRFSLILEWHCFNHRLELSVGDAVKCCSEVNHFKCFLDTLYALYSQSPKCQRELAECASELQVQLHRIGRVLDVRWVASSCRTVPAVWKSYAALHSHFVRKAGDQNFQEWPENWKVQCLCKILA
jgi:hypothetical protein